MDPHLEDPELWPDLHISLITYIRDALQPVLQPRYRARMDLRLYVARSNRNIYPDVTVVHEDVAAYAPAGVAEPYIVTSPIERRREPYIEIIHSASGEVVTAIELLSPANKLEGEGRRQYLRKQDELLSSNVNLVEIDLLSSGARVTPELRNQAGKLVEYRYIICVNRADDGDRTRCETYPIVLSSVLPTFRIPLRSPDPDVTLDLRAILIHAYDTGGYTGMIDYTKPARAPMSVVEATWTLNLLREKGYPITT